MNKKLEADLISIAHAILKLKDKEDVIRVHELVSALHEKLSALKFMNEHFDEKKPTVGTDSSFFESMDQVFNNEISDAVELDDVVYVNVDDKDIDVNVEPGIETIKDIVAQMPYESVAVDEVMDQVNKKSQEQISEFDALVSDFKDIPEFDPIAENLIKDESVSLNDSLKKGEIHIGLNDKIAFLNQLFDGDNSSYDNVLDKLNKFNALEEAKHFLLQEIKPKFNNWEGRDEVEERFMEIIETRFK
jgi:hypothetical protein